MAGLATRLRPERRRTLTRPAFRSNKNNAPRFSRETTNTIHQDFLGESPNTFHQHSSLRLTAPPASPLSASPLPPFPPPRVPPLRSAVLVSTRKRKPLQWLESKRDGEPQRPPP